MNETLNNTMAVIMIVILCLMAIALLAICLAALLDSIMEWKEHKAKMPPKKWR